MIQESIKESPLYNLFQIACSGGDVKKYYDENIEIMPEAQRKQVMKDFVGMVDMVKKYPGLTGVKIDESVLGTIVKPSDHPTHLVQHELSTEVLVGGIR